MHEGLMTVSGLSVLTGKSRRKVTERLTTLEPVEVERQKNRVIRWYLPADALPMIYRIAGSHLDLTDERARLAKEQADKTEMDNAVRRGELVEVETVRIAVGTSIQNAKTRLLSIPSALAKYLENKSATDIESQLSDAIHESLTELAEQPFGFVD